MLKAGTQLAEAASDLNVEELMHSKVLERLTDAETLATLNQLLDKLPLIAFLLESLEGFISRARRWPTTFRPLSANSSLAHKALTSPRSCRC